MAHGDGLTQAQLALACKLSVDKIQDAETGFAAKATTAPRIVVVPGDHGLAKAKGDDSETDENIDLCAAAAVLWAKRLAPVADR